MTRYKKTQGEGEWMGKDWSGISVPGYMACSNCNAMIPIDSAKMICLPRIYFCPLCGAKMKGANNDS